MKTIQCCTRLRRLALLLICLALQVFEASASYPLVRNFKRSEYKGGAQTWAIAPTADGTMLFGNTYGMMLYDSEQWLMRPVPNNTTVRSILVDEPASRIYVGASGEFGYFSPTGPGGLLIYNSLVPTIIGNNAEFAEIWDVYQVGGRVWFRSDNALFVFDGTSTTKIDTGRKITASALAGGTIYLAFSDGNIATVNTAGDLGVRQLRVPGLPLADRVCQILPTTAGGTQLLLITRFHGIYSLEGAACVPFHTPVDPFIRENQAFSAAISGDRLAVGTVKNGVAIVDLTAGSTTYLNIDTGLQNNTVLSAEFDADGNLWLGLDNGLDYAMLNSPMSKLLGDNDRYGAGYVSYTDGNTLYLGTNQGLFSTPYPTSANPVADVPTPIITGQIWGIDHVGNTLFACADAGLYYRRGTAFEQVEGLLGTLSVTPVAENPDMALASTYDGFYAIVRDAGGRWKPLSRVAGYADIAGRPIADSDGSLWLSHWIKGVYRLHFNPDRMLFDRVELFDTTRGFPSVSSIRPNRTSSGIVFSTDAGLYRYDHATASMVPHIEYGDTAFPRESAVIYTTPWGQTWTVSARSVNVITGSGAATRIDSVSFRPIVERIIPGYEHLNFISPTSVIVAGQDGFFEVNSRHDSDSRASGNPARRLFFSAITANRDSLLLSDMAFPDTLAAPLTLSHNLNNLRFEYVMPEFRYPDAVVYRYRMVNYDTDWSPFSTESNKEYTRLSPGNYTFEVEAFNTYTGQRSSAAVHVHIRHPWYSSTAARIIYFLLLVAAAWLVVWRMRRSLELSARRQTLEKEKQLRDMKLEAQRQTLSRDVEIERLKGEQLRHDIRHKSNELSNVTMNMMRKNETLLEISSRLDRIVEQIDDPQMRQRIERQVDTIRRLIRENISHDDDWRSFAHNFDIVYEKYLAHLLERYPDLTPRDQRLCAYIRMGLSSKEIAPLMNISFRSVEMNRYRLRKKMNLPSDTSLSDYLLHFSSSTPETDTAGDDAMPDEGPGKEEA